MRLTKTIMLCAVMATASLSAQAQEANKDTKKWEVKGIVGTNVSQVGLTNWSAGGENSVSGNIFLNASFTYKKDKWLWVNNVALDYGLSQTKTQGVRKTTDKISLTSQLGYSINDKWFYTLMGDFNSQFAKGYNYPNTDTYISKMFAPAYVNLSAGMEYRHKKMFSVFFSPISSKNTIVGDDYLSGIGAFGVEKGKHFKFEAGSFLKARAELPIMENVDLVTVADLFTSYNHNFGNVDVNWDVFIKMKINKFLTATVNTTLKYDDDVKTFDPDTKLQGGAKVQFKEVIGVGLSYAF